MNFEFFLTPSKIVPFTQTIRIVFKILRIIFVWNSPPGLKNVPFKA